MIVSVTTAVFCTDSRLKFSYFT